VVGRPAYPGLLLFKMLLVGLWHGGLSDEAVKDMTNVNLHVVRAIVGIIPFRKVFYVKNRADLSPNLCFPGRGQASIFEYIEVFYNRK
jgi:hypothetical protein